MWEVFAVCPNNLAILRDLCNYDHFIVACPDGRQFEFYLNPV